MTNRFNRDYALVRESGQVLAESHDANRLHLLRSELASEGVVSSVIASDLPRENWIDQNYRADRYGVALMMIREGCSDPSGLARRVLSEFGA